MTPMMRKTLVALAVADQGTMTIVDLRRVAGATMRGFRQIKARMEDQGLVEPAPYCGVPRLSITDVGLQALEPEPVSALKSARSAISLHRSAIPAASSLLNEIDEAIAKSRGDAA